MRKNSLEETFSSVVREQKSRGQVLQSLGTAAGSGGGNYGLAQLLSFGQPASSNGQSSSVAQDFLSSIRGMTDQLTGLKSITQSQIDTIIQNTQALAQNTAKSTGSSVLGAVGQAASSAFGGLSVLSPILSGIFSLFGGGGSSSTPAAPVRFTLPQPVSFQGGIDYGGGSGISAVDYGQNGLPRAIAAQPAASQPPPAQITVNVTAMDSRSFLDHRDDIAQAVREAMLHSNSLNDVVADL